MVRYQQTGGDEVIEIDSAQLTLAELLKELAPTQRRKNTYLLLISMLGILGAMVTAVLMRRWLPPGIPTEVISLFSVVSMCLLVVGLSIKFLLKLANPSTWARNIDEQLASEQRLVKMLISRPPLLLRETGEYIDFEVSMWEGRLSEVRLAAIGIPAIGILVHFTSPNVPWLSEFYTALIAPLVGAVGGAVLLSRALERVRRVSYVLRRACEQGRTFELSADPLIRASSPSE